MRLLLKIIKALIRPKKIPVSPAGVKRILVIDFAFLGDMVMTSPVYRALKEHFPDASVEALVFPFSREVLKTNPYVDEVHVHPAGMFRFDWKIISALRKRKYDLGIQVNTSLRNNFILWKIHPRYRLGYDYRDRGCFHNLRVPLATRTARMKYRVDEELELLEQAFGWKIMEREMIFRVGEDAKRHVQETLKQDGIAANDVVVGIHSNSRQTQNLRRWDQQKFAELSDRIIREYHAKIIFTGSQPDSEYIDGIIEHIHGKDQVLRGLQYTVEELGALFQRMNLFITINTGPMHIAIAQKTPTVALIGGTPAHVVFPKNNRHFQYVMDPGLETWDPEPVNYSYMPNMQEISVDAVWRKVQMVMNDRPGFQKQ